MKILFIGSVEFSKKIFDEIIKSKNEIVGVIGKKKIILILIILILLDTQRV